MTLKLNGSTSGSVSLDAPASTTGGAAITFKFPVADGTSGQVLKTDGSGNLSWVDQTQGGIVQVVKAVTTAANSTTSETFVDTDLTANITPTSASNQILFQWTHHVALLRSASDLGGGIRGMRDSTEVIKSGSYNWFWNGTNVQNVYFRADGMCLDAPNTTSQITYKTQMKIYQNSNSGSITVNHGTHGDSTLLLMEIAGGIIT